MLSVVKVLADTHTPQTVPEVLHTILSLPRVRRAPGMSGALHRLAEATAQSDLGLYVAEGGAAGVRAAVYLDAQGEVSVWPTSLTLQVRLS